MMSQTKKLSIAFYWHMHQPVYQLTPDGDFLMPWVRLHAVKDYLDMVEILAKFKNLKLNFNLVPVLLDSIIDYAENGMHDIHSRLTVSPMNMLSDDAKLFIINNFFDANYQSMIFPYEEYNRLYHKIQSNPEAGINIFTNQEYSDLMALFNLAWIDPTHKSKYPELKKLYKKGKNYTDEDRITIIEIQRDIMRQIIPTYKKFLEKGRIEITTSPYYHPILPILLESKSIKKTTDGFPQNLKTYLDGKLQTKFALDRIEEIFGKRPRGIWPSEHCVGPKTLYMISSLGVDWTISDEGILSNSINFEFIRDFKGHLEDPYHLVKSYNYKTKANDIKIIFRDATLPNLISFEYPNHNPIAAANDLYDRIKVIQNKLLSSPDKKHLLTIAMDGENCWENYMEDGLSFLKTLYTLIEEDESLETVLISDYMDSENHHKNLSKISSGSWINRNFKLWIDEPMKNLAWSYLKQVRHDFSMFVKKNPLNPHIEYAKRELFICEGSDWFWWYGEPNDSGRDNIFDYIFREHLKNIYLYLGLKVPDYLDEPLTAILTKPSRYPKGEFTPALGTKEDDAWLNAGCIDIPDGPVLRESKLFNRICYGYDKDNFYLRFYLNKYILDNPELSQKTYQMYIYMRNSNKKHSLSTPRLINKTENILPISKEKVHNELQLSIQGNELKLVRLVKSIPGNIWALQSSKEIQSIFDNVLDLSIPFDSLDVGSKETLEFMFVIANMGIKEFNIPNEMLLSVPRTSL
ncbi:hypothetical protein IJZ97_00070 [bacterium]|nr:hypothetical protein [bacterium]